MLPEPGYWEAVREICDRTGTLLLIDETHTLSAGPGGATRAWGLSPDLVTIGKTLGAGIPSAAYGMTEDVQRRIVEGVDPDVIDVGGTGGTLAGNALSLAAMRATLERCPDRRRVRPHDRDRRNGSRTASATSSSPGSSRGTSCGSGAVSSTSSVPRRPATVPRRTPGRMASSTRSSTSTC